MYDFYIYASYGITFLALAALAGVSLYGLQRARRQCAAADETDEQ
ncbi:MAG: heme exporter protein CcmD [Rhodobiaceae bacterium]|jgi:heme exporter protein CcmD